MKTTTGDFIIKNIQEQYRTDDFKMSSVLQAALVTRIDMAIESALKQQRLEIAHMVANADDLKDCAFELLQDS